MLWLLLILGFGWFTTHSGVTVLLRETRRESRLFRCSLALGLSLGFSSVIFYLWRVAGGSATRWYGLLELICWLVLAGLFRGIAFVQNGTRFRWISLLLWLPMFRGLKILRAVAMFRWLHSTTRSLKPTDSAPIPDPESNTRSLTGLVWLFGFCMGLVLFFQTLHRPVGTNDSVSIWNLHAKVLYEGGSDWRDFFLTKVDDTRLAALHPDYPWMLSATVARCWTLIGSPSPIVPGFIAIVWTVLTITLCAGAVHQWRGRLPAQLASLTLLGTLYFIIQGGSQYADVPLSFFILATLALMCQPTRSPKTVGGWVLAGSTTGLAVWTKNEGQLFLLIISGCVFLSAIKQGSRAILARMVWFLTGLTPILIGILLWKLSLPLTTDLVAENTTDQIQQKLFDVERYRLIATTYLAKTWRVLRGFVVALPLAFWLLGRSPQRHAIPNRNLIPLAIGLMLAGYFFVYVLTPHPLQWHLNTSLSRLLIHLWPGTVLWCFLTLKSPEASNEREACEPTASA